MKRWMIAVTAASLAASVAVPVQASDWCVHDPRLDIETSGRALTIYVTEGVLGSEHQATLASAKITYTTTLADRDTLVVTVSDYIPTDIYGAFATEMVVSSQPFGSGTIYGSAFGTSGSTINVSFWINTKNGTHDWQRRSMPSEVRVE